MTAEEIQKIKIIVESTIDALRGKLGVESGETDPIEPDVSIGRLSRLDSMQMQQMALNAKRRQEDQLKKLEEALSRIETDAYGKCVFCQQDIGFARLEVQPEALMCVGCAP